VAGPNGRHKMKGANREVHIFVNGGDHSSKGTIKAYNQFGKDEMRDGQKENEFYAGSDGR